MTVLTGMQRVEGCNGFDRILRMGPIHRLVRPGAPVLPADPTKKKKLNYAFTAPAQSETVPGKGAIRPYPAHQI
jgi:hypothetical protein